jgi:hypothetical protein
MLIKFVSQQRPPSQSWYMRSGKGLTEGPYRRLWAVHVLAAVMLVILKGPGRGHLWIADTRSLCAPHQIGTGSDGRSSMGADLRVNAVCTEGPFLLERAFGCGDVSEVSDVFGVAVVVAPDQPVEGNPAGDRT